MRWILAELARKNAGAISRIGEDAREEARRTGTSISYYDRDSGQYLIEWPAEGRIEPMPLSTKN